MTFDGITTNCIVNELKTLLIGAKINKINQISKDTLIFNIYNKKSYSIYISANTSSARINITSHKYENPITPPNFCMLLRKHLQQGKIINFYQLDLDRTIVFEISSYDEMGYACVKKLYLEIMGKYSNITLTDDKEKVIDSIKRVSIEMSRVRQIYPGIQFKTMISEKENILDDFNALDKLNIDSNIKLGKLFYTYYTGFSPIIGKEICYRANLSTNMKYKDLSIDEKNILNKTFLSIVDKIKNGDYSPAIYYEKNKPINFYPLELKHLSEKKEYESLSACLDDYYLLTEKSDKLGQGVNRLKTILKSKLTKESSRLDSMYQRYEETGERDRLKIEGDLLSSNIQNIKKGMKNIELLNYYDGSRVNISLDVRKSPWENAQSKYKKSSKLKKSRELLDKAIPKQVKYLNYLRQINLSLDSVTNLRELEEIEEEFEAEGLIKKKKKNKRSHNKENTSKPDHYKYRNFDIYVGKNNKQNDELTLKMANKEDYFFHAKDIPGAHVILRMNGNEGKLDDDLIFACAWLAAKNSKNSDEQYVPIDYTLKKNVYKEKGAKLGMVYYKEFKTILSDLTDQFDIQKLS